MAIILPGTDVGPTRSPAAPVGINGAVTATLPAEHSLYSPAANRLSAAGPTEAGATAGFGHLNSAPRAGGLSGGAGIVYLKGR